MSNEEILAELKAIKKLLTPKSSSTADEVEPYTTCPITRALWVKTGLIKEE